MRYAPETKKKALESIAEFGVKKTQENMKISMQTLYKWKNEGKGAKAPAVGKRVVTGRKRNAKKANETPAAEERKAAAQKLIQEDDLSLLQKIMQLEAENAGLRIMNDNLKKMLQVYVES